MEFAILLCQLIIIALLIIISGCALAFAFAMSTPEGRQEFKQFRTRRMIRRKMKNVDWGRMARYSEADLRVTLMTLKPKGRSIFDDCVAYHGFNPLTDNHMENA